MGSIRDLQRALELAHYAARHRGTSYVVTLDGDLSVADFQLDLKLLGAYELRVAVVARWQRGAARDRVSEARRQGFPIDLVDGADELDDVVRAARRSFEQKRVPVILAPERLVDGTEPFVAHLSRRLAVALRARRIFWLTAEIEGLLGGNTVPHLTVDEARELSEGASGSAAVDWSTILGALSAGVPGVVVLEGEPGCVFEELFTHQGAGVLVSDDQVEEVRTATLADAADVSLLLRNDMERGIIRPFTEDELLDTIDEHLVYTIDGLVVGTVRLAPWGASAQLTRFATLPRYRGRGHARKLCNALLERAKSRGFEEVFALSIDERHWRFFESIGLMPCERETLPAAWQSRYDFTRPSRAFRIHFDAATQASRSN